MMVSKIRLLYRSETGFTLIEILVSMAITSLIGLGAAVSSAQVLNETSRNNDYNTASRE